MIIETLLAASLLLAGQDQPITLERVFKKGEKGTYKVLSNLQIEVRSQGQETFMPQENDINYTFTYEVTQMKPDGFALIRYKRPTTIEIDLSSNPSGPIKRTIKTNVDLALTLSPINEITDMKDLTPPKKKGGSPLLSSGTPLPLPPPHLWARAIPKMERGFPELQAGIGTFVDELYRLSLFIGSLDSAIDFSPKLPFDEIKPGDTWQKTVGYSPQKIKGKDGKSAVQRLDYTYTYKGIVQAGAKKVHRITASLKLDTDAAPFVNQMMQQEPEESHLKELRLTLDANIDFDLDLSTRKTLRAVATSTGGFKVVVTDSDEPVQEQRIKGRTTMTLLAGK